MSQDTECGKLHRSNDPISAANKRHDIGEKRGGSVID